ncbi:helix-turn-helix transcriptional regulator [Breoghania sp.]|uniref:helix-turn-helix domain-containing protein n=1 Tax=Breoghania sp. TaxID=2065378 RepID=UPI002AA95852|nr:helix-turn-helix transcriptional regulator [Breoghania sp.]
MQTGSKPRPKINTGWFKDRIADKRLSQRKVASLLGVDNSTLSLLLNGRRRMRIDQASELARILSVSVADVMTNAGVPTNERHTIEALPGEIPIIGQIDGADGATLSWDAGAERRVTVPIIAPETARAIQWRASTGRAAFCNGWIAVILPPAKPTPESILDRYCVVAIKDGPTLIKTVRRGFSAGLFNLDGSDGATMHDVKLDWVSPVIGIFPPG